MEPSAPLYAEFIREDSSVNRSLDETQIPELPTSSSDDLSAVSLNKIELDLKKARLKKIYLEKERKLVDDDFQVRIEVVDAEIATMMTTLKSLEKGANEPFTCSPVGHPTVQHQATAQNSHRHVCPASPSPDQRIREMNNRISGIPPNVHSGSVSIGFEQLCVLDCVMTRRLRTRQPGIQAYEVVAPGENLVMFRVSFGVTYVAKFAQLRFGFIDRAANEVMTFRSGPDKLMELYMCGHLVSMVKKAPTYLKTKMDVYDTHARPVLKIKGMHSALHKDMFEVQNMQKTSIGLMYRRPAAPTACYEADHTVIKLPLDLDLRYKATLIAASFICYSFSSSF